MARNVLMVDIGGCTARQVAELRKRILDAVPKVAPFLAPLVPELRQRGGAAADIVTALEGVKLAMRPNMPEDEWARCRRYYLLHGPQAN